MTLVVRKNRDDRPLPGCMAASRLESQRDEGTSEEWDDYSRRAARIRSPRWNAPSRKRRAEPGPSEAEDGEGEEVRILLPGGESPPPVVS